jgi:hypothetical protein
MYPNSPYATPVGSFQVPVVPPGVDPQEGDLVYVGLNCAWLPYIAGALSQLLLQSTWKVSTESELDLVQMQANTLIGLFNCFTLPTLKDLQGLPGSGCEADCMCCLRFQNGVLQQLVCGVWTDVPGQGPGGVNPPDQPGDHTPQPLPNGGQQCYHGQFQASGRWRIPTTVSSGDQITLSRADGAHSSSHSASWLCPDGNTFFAGGCVGGTQFYDVTDPLPTAPSGCLIVNVGSVYLNLSSGLVNIPAGIVNQPVDVLVNDATLAGLSGSLTVDLCVINNASGSQSASFTIAYNDANEYKTPWNTVAGKAYLVTAVGYAQNDPFNPNNAYDAIYTTGDLWTTHGGPTSCCDCGNFGLNINDQPYSTSNAYSSDHAYSTVILGDGLPVRFKQCSGNVPGNYGGPGFTITIRSTTIA